MREVQGVDLRDAAMDACTVFQDIIGTVDSGCAGRALLYSQAVIRAVVSSADSYSHC